MRIEELFSLLNEAETPRSKVKSSWIDSLWFEPYEDEVEIETRYDEDGEPYEVEIPIKNEDPMGTIFMKTKSGKTYEWEDSPRSLYRKWRKSRSKGKYFHNKMKI